MFKFKMNKTCQKNSFYSNISKQNKKTQSLSEKWEIHAKLEALPYYSARRCLLMTTIDKLGSFKI